MENFLGERLLDEDVITEQQLEEALVRQKRQGGRIGHNLVALGYISDEELTSFFRGHPLPPRTVEDTGLELSFICDLVMKHAFSLGRFKLPDLVKNVGLPLAIMDEVVEVLRKDHLLEVAGAKEYGKTTWLFSVTDRGRHRAAELFSICRYQGPAPVILEDYWKTVKQQTVRNILVSEENVRRAFSHLVVSEYLLGQIGPAVSSARAIFLYGPSGNGKTTIAETIGKFLPGTIYVPHALLVGGEIVTIYDLVSHVKVPPELESDSVDQRWILVQRPVVMVGGEFTLRMLDLDFNPIAKFYEGSLQMKANNGLFIVDDFGRQQMEPQALLNRWIVPLERKTDFLSLHTGMKFEIPFDQVVVFATNIRPRELVDEAFLRRIRYKIKIDHPPINEYEQIFRGECEGHGIAYKKDVFDFLVENFYRRQGINLNACHPRDLVDHVVDAAHYRNSVPELTRESISAAWDSYFVEM